MGLLLEEIQKTGAVANYWKIGETKNNWHDGGYYVELLGFISREASENGMIPLANCRFSLDDSDLSGEVDIRAEAYVQIKLIGGSDDKGGDDEDVITNISKDWTKADDVLEKIVE